MTPERSWAEKVAEELRDQYLDVKILPDNTVACLQDLMFTRAILLGVNEYSFTTRFCFEDRALANERWGALQGEDDEPEGYVARRLYK